MLLVVPVCHGETLATASIINMHCFSCTLLDLVCSLQPVIWLALGIIALVKISVGELFMS